MSSKIERPTESQEPSPADGSQSANSATLAEIQETLGNLFRQLLPFNRSEDPQIHNQLQRIVAGNDRLSPIEQAEIYREQYWLRHQDALADDFPGLCYLLGEKRFEALARDYFRCFPPQSFTLRDVGIDLPKYIAQLEPATFQQRDLAHDMARLEWAFVACFDAPDAPCLRLEDVQSISPDDWSRAHLSLVPSLTLLTLNYPVHDLRTAIKAEEEPSCDLVRDPLCIALWRGADLRVHYNRILPGEQRIIQSLSAGESLVDAVEGALAAHCSALLGDEASQEAADFASQLQAWFKRWALRGWFRSLCLDGAG
jgi:hypothetical protein